MGVGQICKRPDHDGTKDRPEPLALMVQALLTAAADCGADHPGEGESPVGSAGSRLLRRADSIRVVSSLVWQPPNPAALVAERIGCSPRQLMHTTTGGNTPQSLVHDCALAISRGELDVVLVTGGEAMHTLAQYLRTGRQAPAWMEQREDVAPPEIFGDDRAPATQLEEARGLKLPIHAYPIFENALRAAHHRSLEEHRLVVGNLWSRFSQVAAANPYAWTPRAHDAEEITVPSAENRMVAFPYTKLCTANVQVDLAAAYICCSVAAARDCRVPSERWVFPLSGAEANDHWFLSERADLHSSPAIRLAGRRALGLAGLGIDDIGEIDLYSCFPSAVQIAGAELGLPLDDPDRPLTVTGGLTWAGGPGNNYTSHAIAAMVRRLRHKPGASGMVTGLGWYATKHAVGLYASRPPDHQGVEPFRFSDVQDEVDALPAVLWDADIDGKVRIESYTVTYDRSGEPRRAVVACRDGQEHRTWGGLTEPAALLELVNSEGVGRPAVLRDDGLLELA